MPALKGAIGSNRVEPPEPGVAQRNAAGRLRDMDREGRDVDLIIPGTFSTAITAIDPTPGEGAVRRLPPLHRRLLLGRPGRG